MQDPGLDPQFNSTHHKLMLVNRRYHLIYILKALLWLAFWGMAIFSGAVLIEAVFDLTTPLRFALWAVLFGLFIFVSIKQIIPNLRCAFSPAEQDLYHISREIGKSDPEIQDSLINFLQIYRDEGIAAHPAFKNLSLKQLYKRFKNTDFFKIISLQGLRTPALRLLTAGAIFLLVFLLFPGSTSQTFLKMLHPTKSFEKPLPVSLANLSGDQIVLKNDPVRLKGEYNGIMPSSLWLVVQSQNDAGDSTSTERLKIALNAGKSFDYEINHVKDDFTYWFEANVNIAAFDKRMAFSKKSRIIVKARPYIRDLQAKLTFPKYTRMTPALLPPNDGEITALAGTSVELNIESNKSLNAAWIEFKDSTRQLMQITENRARGQFVVRKDDQYRIVIRDADDIENYQPVQYSIFALRDENPFVEITQPGEDLDLGDELQLPLLINLRDDFGFSRLLLKGKHVKNGSSGDTSYFSLKIPFQRLDRSRAISEYAWDLSPFYLIPDDYIEYYAEVRDNDAVSGPKSARSRSFIIRLPSLMDVIESTRETLTEKLDDTEDVSEESRKLKEKLEEINRELKREEELTWERKQQIQEQVDRQQQNMEKLKEVRQELEEMVNQMDQQDMLSPETLEKYFELQKMFQDLATPEMMEAMKELQKALEDADMDEVREAMERFQLSMEDFEERIERTYELFKRVQLEQKMDELNKMAEKMLEEQKKINEELQQENLNDTQKEQLANKEQDLSKNADYMKNELQNAQKAFEEMMDEIAKSLENAENFMENEQISEQMQQMQQQMQQGDQQQSQQSGKKIQKQLEMLQSMMQQAQQNMQQQQKEELMQAMQKVQQDLLRSSFQQEKLLDKSRKMDMASSKLTDAARQQSQLRENAGNIIKQMVGISQKSFFISPEMSKTMSSLMESMESALQSLANRNPRSAARSQQKAMGDFNQAIMSMQNSMNNMMQSGSGTGFEQFMQQLQQMAGQQGQLNQQTMGLFQQGQRPNGQVPGQSLAQAAAQQQMIRNSLEKMSGQMGNRQDVLGRLNDLGEEMEKVIADLKKQKLDPKVIERQQKILSRMLDAQKSVREKEHSKKRLAEHEKNVITKSPPQLKKEMIERENKLRKEMLEALKEGYSSEYKAYIKSYYDILSRQSELKP